MRAGRRGAEQEGEAGGHAGGGMRGGGRRAGAEGHAGLGETNKEGAAVFLELDGRSLAAGTCNVRWTKLVVMFYWKRVLVMK